jgi:histidinol-phosphate aminotransferase
MPVDVFPSGANFVLFRPTQGIERLSGHAVWQGLIDRSVLVRDCSSWPRLENCLRVTVGNPAENSEFLDALQIVLEDGEAGQPSNEIVGSEVAADGENS